VFATHDPQIAARCGRLIRLRDGSVVDDIELTDGYPADETIRRGPGSSAGRPWLIGRAGRIRTGDLVHPKHAR
jgi:hypothetical protein